MDYDQLFIEFNVGVARQTCLSSEVRLRLEHKLRGGKKFEGKCAMQADLLKEKDAEIASLKAQLSQKEAEAVEAIRLRGQEHNSTLEEEKSVLERKVVALESANATKVAELASLTAQTAKLTQDLSELGLSCDELSVKASSLEVERDRIISQDEQVKVLSDMVAGLDAELMGMALHLDEEFYPRFLTTIAGRRWILCRGLRLVVVKCLQSPEYLAALGGAIGHAIDKGMQDGLTAGIDHGKAGKGLVDVAAYNPSAEANMSSLQMSFGLAAEFPEANQLQPSPEQLMLPIHHLEDQVVIGETSLSFSLDVVHSLGEANTSGVPAVVTATTTLSTTFVEASSVLPIPASDYEVVDTEAQAETSSSHKIIFEEETLETSPENPTT
ncbi:hypothetical protein Tco_0711537 [Tanacetum coccineum]